MQQWNQNFTFYGLLDVPVYKNILLGEKLFTMMNMIGYRRQSNVFDVNEVFFSVSYMYTSIGEE